MPPPHNPPEAPVPHGLSTLKLIALSILLLPLVVFPASTNATLTQGLPFSDRESLCADPIGSEGPHEQHRPQQQKRRRRNIQKDVRRRSVRSGDGSASAEELQCGDAGRARGRTGTGGAGKGAGLKGGGGAGGAGAGASAGADADAVVVEIEVKEGKVIRIVHDNGVAGAGETKGTRKLVSRVPILCVVM